MSQPRAWAIVPSSGRPYLDDLLISLATQVDDVLVVANNWQRPEGARALRDSGAPVDLLDGPDEQNISRWWNLGVDAFAEQARACGETEWDVLVVNDDVICPPGFVETLSTRMRATTAVLAYPDQAGGRDEILHTEPGPVPLSKRITGYAFMLRGETGLRFDESMAWWASDDDLDWQARERGGALLVPGIPVEHRYPNGSMYERPELQAQAGRDMETFRTKWGKTPW